MDDHAAIVPLSPGDKVREFKIDSQLGEGSFGIVYVATHEILGEMVAIKEFLPRDLARRREGNRIEALPNKSEAYEWARAKFLREARTLKSLADPEPHPNLIQVIHAFAENDTVYMCMGYEEGTPLDKLLSEHGSADEKELRKILFPLLDGLEHAHAHGVWHCDIKPSNILIRNNGSPVLIDFGAARQEVSRQDRSVLAQCTPGYAAPEQLWGGEEQGPWTDIYGLGATLYRALTGEPPQGFSRMTLREDYKERYSEGFLDAIDIALEPKPADRPQSVREWRDRFDSNARGPKSAVEPTVLQPAAGSMEPTRVVAPHTPTHVSSGPVRSPQPSANPLESKRKPRTWVWMSLGVALATVVTVTLLRWFPLTAVEDKPIEPPLSDQRNRDEVASTSDNKQGLLELGPETKTETLAEVQHLLAGLRCGRLNASLSPDRVLTLNGFLDSEEELADLRTRLLAFEHVERLRDDEVQIQVWPFCQVIASLADAAVDSETGTRKPSILLNKKRGKYREGEYLVVTAMNNTPHEGSIYLDYVDVTGDVVHMLPTPTEPDNRVAGWGEVFVGADDDEVCLQQQCYKISPPHGRSLLVAVWSREPLLSEPRDEIVEQAIDYFALLETLIRNAQNRDAEGIAMSYQFLDTRE